MKLGIVIYSNDTETAWNGFRLGVFALKRGDQVRSFFLGKGVECEELDRQDKDLVYSLLGYHYEYTRSLKAKSIIDRGENEFTKFIKVMPIGYKRILGIKTPEEQLDLAELSD